MSQVIDIVSLYPKDMNIYGDSGNVLTIQRRLALYGYEPRVHAYNQGCDWPEHVDMILGGGGQDTGQKKIIDDFFQRADLLRSLAADGVPMLMICGLFGLAVGGVVIYGAFADGRPPQRGSRFPPSCSALPRPWPTALPLRREFSDARPRAIRGRAAALRSLALAGVVASVFGLGLCYATGGQLPTSLIFNLLLMAICVVIAGNLGKSAQ